MRKYTIITILQILFSISVTYAQEHELPYYNLEEDCNLDSSRIVANSMQEFRRISDCDFVGLNFDRYTIIGIKGLSPGHFDPKIDFRILQNRDSKTINIEILLSGGKSCPCRVMKPFYKRMIYIDKIEEGYTYKFKYIYTDN
jgi:hypothetical protein